MWDETLCLIGVMGESCSGSAREKIVGDRSSEKCFNGDCKNLPIVADVNLSYAGKSPNSMRGVIFMNYIVDRGCNVYGSASVLALRV